MKFIVLLAFFISSSAIADTFVDFCESKKLSEAERTAMEQLKKIENVKSCQELDKQINKSNIIWDNNFAENCEISDIGFLRYFPNLKRLSLGCHPIEDITPIGYLTNLKDLMLNSPKIKDLSPLGNLRNLDFVNLEGIGTQDLSALQNATKLTKLFVNGSTLSACSDSPKIMSPFCKAQLRLEDTPYVNRYVLIGMTKTHLALKHYYRVDECCGGREGYDCKYPGLTQDASKNGAPPSGGLSIHIAKFNKDKEINPNSSRSRFQIYRGAFEKARCSSMKESKKELNKVKSYAKSKNLALGHEPMAGLLVSKLNVASLPEEPCKGLKSCKFGSTDGPYKISGKINHSFEMYSLEFEIRGPSKSSIKKLSVNHKTGGPFQVILEHFQIFGEKDKVLEVSLKQGGGMAGTIHHPYFFKLN